jgi:hypothetical protein
MTVVERHHCVPLGILFKPIVFSVHSPTCDHVRSPIHYVHVYVYPDFGKSGLEVGSRIVTGEQ